MIKFIVKREACVNSNAFYCYVDKYELVFSILCFKRWRYIETYKYTSFDYFLINKVPRGSNYIMEVI